MSYQISDGQQDDRIGTRVGGYRIESLAGVGGMAKVYSATADDGRRVALKIVNQQYSRDEMFRRRFEREARIAQTVCHPHLVPVLDAGQHNGLPYVAQQFIDGNSLDEKIKRDGRIDLPTTLRICAEVAEGLQALSDAGMVHRDVKPANIMLDRSEKAYLTDFGLAKDTQGSVLTAPGQTLGSLHYMAPEQIRGDSVSSSADIYSLGCVVFECLQGRPPFGDRQGMRVLWAHLNDEPADPAGASPEFTQALKAALRKEPAERPTSFVEYVRSLRGSVADSPVCLAG
jgi:serine/threonine protein kinase